VWGKWRKRRREARRMFWGERSAFSEFGFRKDQQQHKWDEEGPPSYRSGYFVMDCLRKRTW